MESDKRIALDTWISRLKDGSIQGYLHCHDSSLPTIHFLHGNGFAVKTYSCFLSKLEGYNLFMQDAAGHGGSSIGKRFVGWNKTAARFIESLEQQEKQLPDTGLIGMGHSFGGCMTVLMNEQKPFVFNQMILLDPAIFPPRLIWMMRGVKLSGLTSQVPLAKQARRRRTQWDSYAQVRESFFERGVFKGWESECLDDYISASIKCDEKGHYQLGCPAWMEAAVFSSYPKGLWRAIKNISIPTFIVQGEDTFDYFKEAYRLAAKINPNITVIEVKGGHCFMQQNSDQSAEVVMGLLRNKGR